MAAVRGGRQGLELRPRLSTPPEPADQRSVVLDFGADQLINGRRLRSAAWVRVAVREVR
jgi:hypothetical protein